MTQIKQILDEFGIINNASKNLPKPLWEPFILSLAELEDNECHRTLNFPITRLHKLEGIKEPIYRADIEKTSGWRIHLQYCEGKLYLKDILCREEHDHPIRVVKSKRGRYEK